MDVRERMQKAKLIWDEAQDSHCEKEDNEKKKAEDIRRKVAEYLRETVKRKEEEEGRDTSKKKRKYTEAVFLAEQGLKLRQEIAEINKKMREEGLDERRKVKESHQQMMEMQQVFFKICSSSSNSSCWKCNKIR